MLELLPQVWDAWTLVRIVFVAVGAAAFFRVGLDVAPRAFAAFESVTSGYVAWMRGEFDRMYMEVPASWCAGAITGCVLLGVTIFYLFVRVIFLAHLIYTAKESDKVGG